MRYTRLRFDIWLCLLLAFLAGLGTVKLAGLVLPGMYEAYVQEHVVADNDIGGRAGTDVFRARSVDDILSHDTFTIVSPGIEYRNRGAGYYGSYYLYAVTLPSGERVAAAINMESVRYEGEYYSSEHTLPVGRVVYEDLTSNEYFMNQIEFREPLSRTDFYVDMQGVGGVMSQEDYFEPRTNMVQVVTVLVCFPLLHAMGSALGLFPRFFPPRKKKGEEEKKGEWD